MSKPATSFWGLQACLHLLLIIFVFFSYVVQPFVTLILLLLCKQRTICINPRKCNTTTLK